MDKVTQVVPAVDTKTRRAFDLADGVHDSVYKIRAQLQVLADCALNAATAEESNQQGFLTASAISCVVESAIQSLPEIEQSVDELWKMTRSSR